MLQHLRVLLPAAAAAVWVLGKLRDHSKPQSPAAATQAEDSGDEVEVELPTKGPQLPFPDPPPHSTLLLDVTVPLSLTALWLALFHNSSQLLSDFHKQLGDVNIDISSWRLKDNKRQRVLRYTTPLHNPFGPRQAVNTEVLEAAHLGSNGFVLRATCTSEGVPFASHFNNQVQWVATPHGTHSCRLVVTGECQFLSRVWGPLQGQIKRESVKGMAQAYRTLIRMLERQYSAVPAGAGPAAGSAAVGSNGAQRAALSGKFGTGAGVALDADARAAVGAAHGTAAGGQGVELEGLNLAAMLQNPQTNAAAFLAIVVVMVLVWRLVFLQPVMLQALRSVATVAAVAAPR